jgi:hypothetical protein
MDMGEDRRQPSLLLGENSQLLCFRLQALQTQVQLPPLDFLVIGRAAAWSGSVHPERYGYSRVCYYKGRKRSGLQAVLEWGGREEGVAV